MSHYRKRLLLAVLIGCFGAVGVLGGPASAVASITCQSPGYASGDSLQAIAMSGVWLQSADWGAHTSCSAMPVITYSSTSDSQALEEFGDIVSSIPAEAEAGRGSAGYLHPRADMVAYGSETGTTDVEGQVLDWYVGTEYAPDGPELSYAQAAAGAKAHAQITIPIGQGPIAVLLSLPTHCKIQAGSALDLNNTTLGQMWEGANAHSGEDPGGIQAQGGYAIATWGALLHQLGYSKITSGTPGSGQFLDEGGSNGCEQTIKSQVSENMSGTADVFKTYLEQINWHVWEGYASYYRLWPTSAVVDSDPLSSGSGEQLNDSNAHLASNTAANPGSVGYANTADAAASGSFTHSATSSTFGTGGGHSTAHQILWAEIQNNGTSTSGATYTDPLIGSSSIANCETEKLVPSDYGIPEEYTGPWTGITATDPEIATDGRSADYSLCALMFELVWHHYSNNKLFGKTATAEYVANSVKDLFEYLIGQGQTDIQGHDYTRFPSEMASHVRLAVNPGIGY